MLLFLATLTQWNVFIQGQIHYLNKRLIILSLFDIYILNFQVANDDAVIVRTAFAENIAELAATALR